eukprot:3725061-Pleurochrysis_carterae.AAC.1
MSRYRQVWILCCDETYRCSPTVAIPPLVRYLVRWYPTARCPPPPQAGSGIQHCGEVAMHAWTGHRGFMLHGLLVGFIAGGLYILAPGWGRKCVTKRGASARPVVPRVRLRLFDVVSGCYLKAQAVGFRERSKSQASVASQTSHSAALR